jgi:hypothetical protein
MAIPYAFSPMVLSLLMGRKMGIFAAIYGGLLTSFFFPAPKFIIALLCGIAIGYVAVLATRSVNSRNRLLRAGIMFGLAGLAVSFLLELSHLAALTQGNLALERHADHPVPALDRRGDNGPPRLRSIYQCLNPFSKSPHALVGWNSPTSITLSCDA